MLEVPELWNASVNTTCTRRVIETMYRSETIISTGVYTSLDFDDMLLEYGSFYTPLPFSPEMTDRIEFAADVKWHAKTMTLVSSLNCSQIDDFNVSASSVAIDGVFRSAVGARVSMRSRDDCTLLRDWDSLSGVDNLSSEKPPLSDGTFAI
jgi:hypothetical protein